MQTGLGRKDWIAIAVCVAAVPLFIFQHSTSISTSCGAIGGAWFFASAWLDSRNSLVRRSIPQIYAAFRSGKVPQQPWLPSLLTWGGMIWALAGLTSCVV